MGRDAISCVGIVAELAHASQGEGAGERMLGAPKRSGSASAAIRAWPRPSRQSQGACGERTYERLCEQAFEAEMRAEDAFAIRAERLMARIKTARNACSGRGRADGSPDRARHTRWHAAYHKYALSLPANTRLDQISAHACAVARTVPSNLNLTPRSTECVVANGSSRFHWPYQCCARCA